MNPLFSRLLLVLSLALPALWAQRPAEPPRPKLLVILVVDQFRADYIAEYGGQWTAGLRRLLDDGAWFTEAAYAHFNTVTCAGHATISTGSFPARHGVVLNEWWDRRAARETNCTEDARARGLGYGADVREGHSAWRLEVSSLAEEMDAGARVAAFSIKARSAIMLAGKRRDAAVAWFDDRAGAWAGSSAYAGAPFLEEFAAANPAGADFGKQWMRALPEESYRHADDDAAERPPAGWNRVFPHRIAGAGLWRRSPFSDAALGRLAQAGIDALALGRRPRTDFLGVSFSALDLVGHRFGPRSHEVQDTLAQLDRTLGTLLEHLDQTVGAENYVVALSADHGVAPIPEQIGREGVSAGRISTWEIAAAVEKVLDEKMGQADYVAVMKHTDFYFRPGVYARLRRRPQALAAVLETILAAPGVERVFRSEELPRLRRSADPIARAAALGYFPGRSGDLIVIPRPYWFSSADAATHGTARDYDARVPLILFGRGIRAGRYAQPATPADIAPTLAHLAGVRFPRRDGRVLREALENSTAPSGPRR